MSNIQSQISEIIAARAAKLRETEKLTSKWQALAMGISKAIGAIEEAERLNPEISGSATRLRSVMSEIRSFQDKAGKITARFSRNSLCIGIRNERQHHDQS